MQSINYTLRRRVGLQGVTILVWTTRPAIVEKPIAIKSDPIPISLEDRFPEQLSWNSKKRFPNFDMASIDLEPTLEFTLYVESGSY